MRLKRSYLKSWKTNRESELKMSKVILITGFLGSGKTTLLKTLLKDNSQEYKIAVIQNEFADSSIDSIELKMTKWNFELIEINRGSIFCICLYANFREELERLVKEKSPDIIFIEASGLADPLSIGTLLNNSDNFHLAGVLTVADPALFLRMSGQVRSINNQIRAADIVIVNKCDKCSKEDLDLTTERVKEINPETSLYYTSYCEGVGDLRALLTQLSEIQKTEIRTEPDIEPGSNEAVLSQRPDDIFSNVFRTPEPIEEATILDFCTSVPESVLRLKGFLRSTEGRSYIIQYVKGDQCASIAPCEPVSISQVIAIGTKKSDFTFFNRLKRG